MDKIGLPQFLIDKGTAENEIESFLAVIERFTQRLPLKSEDQRADISSIERFSDELVRSGQNTWNNYLALARYFQYRQDFRAFRFIVEYIDGSEVMDNLYEKVLRTFGEVFRDRLFEDIQLPPIGTPNSRKYQVTQQIMSRLESQISQQSCRDLLADSLRDLPDEQYLPQRQKYQTCESLDDYLTQRGRDFILELETIKNEGGLYFTQPVTDEVIQFVRTIPEIAQGVRQGNTLFKIKIPYMTVDYLTETDEKLKRYHYCHCPWVRESLKTGDVQLSSTFCNCSAGFMKKPWEVIFDRPLEAEMVETVLDGDPWCRVAIQLPEGIK